MKTCPWLLLIPFLAIGAACQQTQDITSSPEPIPAGAMAYTGYDENGIAVVEGWVKLDVLIITNSPTIPTNVTGTWKLRRVGLDGEVGPQVGEGVLEGLLRNEVLSVNLNPSHADDNVVAEGVFKVIGDPPSGTQWEGTWIWSTLSGPKRTGTFRASSEVATP